MTGDDSRAGLAWRPCYNANAVARAKPVRDSSFGSIGVSNLNLEWDSASLSPGHRGRYIGDARREPPSGAR